MQGRADVYPVVLLEGEGCQHFVGRSRVGHAARDQFYDPAQSLRRQLVDVKVSRVDDVGAGTRRLPVGGNADAGDRGHAGQPGQARHGGVVEHVGVVAVRGDEAGEGRGSAAPRRHCGQGQSAHDGNEEDQNQPRSPPPAELTTEHKQDSAHTTSHASVTRPDPAPQGRHHVGRARATTTRAVGLSALASNSAIGTVKRWEPDDPEGHGTRTTRSLVPAVLVQASVTCANATARACTSKAPCATASASCGSSLTKSRPGTDPMPLPTI